MDTSTGRAAVPERDDMNTQHTIAEQLDCIERALRFRRHVYPRRVADGKMTPAAADHQIAVMESVKASLERIGREQKELPL